MAKRCVIQVYISHMSVCLLSGCFLRRLQNSPPTNQLIISFFLSISIHSVFSFILGMRSEEVVERAINMFVSNIESGSCVDEQLQDKVCQSS